MFRQIQSEDELNELMKEDSIIFKHSNRCSLSAQAKEEVESFVEDTEEEVNYLVVQDQRDLSDLVEDETGVRHETPQILIFEDGKVKWHASHKVVTSKNIKKNLE